MGIDAVHMYLLVITMWYPVVKKINGILKRKTECAACLKYSVLIFVEKYIRNATFGG
jgi:hypothetical protein